MTRITLLIFGAVSRKVLSSPRLNVQAVYGFYHFRCAILMSFFGVFGSPLHPLKLQY